MNGNKVVILIPSYNANEELFKTLRSIDKKEHVDVLVVDDGSDIKPKERELNENFLAQGNIFLLALEHNEGITSALNSGLKWIYERPYLYIARLDAGDFCKSERFVQQEAFLSNNPDYGIVGAWVNFIDEKYNFLFTLKHPTEDHDIRKVIYRYNPFVHPATMFRVDRIKEINGYPKGYPALEDWACFIKLIDNCKAYTINAVLLDYVVSTNSISTKKRFRQSLSKVKLLINNFKFTVNNFVGLFKNIVLLLLPRSILTTLKKVVKS
ncbi:glycosyltransferase [Vibrio sp. 10N.286.52.B1]|uniref:glycosyltransferase n=1 Tax=Vibrio sp. 10N.286.52.B1 TaxID=3229712 RepID=UPI00354E0131